MAEPPIYWTIAFPGEAYKLNDRKVSSGSPGALPGGLSNEAPLPVRDPPRYAPLRAGDPRGRARQVPRRRRGVAVPPALPPRPRLPRPPGACLLRAACPVRGAQPLVTLRTAPCEKDVTFP